MEGEHEEEVSPDRQRQRQHRRWHTHAGKERGGLDDSNLTVYARMCVSFWMERKEEIIRGRKCCLTPTRPIIVIESQVVLQFCFDLSRRNMCSCIHVISSIGPTSPYICIFAFQSFSYREHIFFSPYLSLKIYTYIKHPSPLAPGSRHIFMYLLDS